MPSLNTVIKQASRGADLYFVFRFLRLLTMKYEKTDAYKYGIIDKKGKVLRKSSELETTDEKASYTMLHRLVFKIRGLIEKVPILGKSILLNYAAALFLLKEQKNPRIWTDENYAIRKLNEFLENEDWIESAKVLREEVEQMSKLKFGEYLAEGGHEDVASAKNQVKIAMDALQKMNTELGKLPDNGSLPTWWTNKVAIAVDNLDGMADYLDTQVESVVTNLIQSLEERKMTDAEMDKREKIVLSLKKKKKEFKDRYGDDAKNVMYATATKMAMGEAFYDLNIQQINSYLKGLASLPKNQVMDHLKKHFNLKKIKMNMAGTKVLAFEENEEEVEEDKRGPCWRGYVQKGMKKKGNKLVPNCVPEAVGVRKVDFVDGVTEAVPTTSTAGVVGTGDDPATWKRDPKKKKKDEEELRKMMGESVKTSTFAGKQVFVVDSDMFHQCRLGKAKYHRYEKYVGKKRIGKAIREYGLKFPKRPIILQNGEGGPMLYLRYGRS